MGQLSPSRHGAQRKPSPTGATTFDGGIAPLVVLYQEANGALSEPLRPTSPTWNETIVRSDCAVALPTTGGLRQNKNTRLMTACSRLRAQSGGAGDLARVNEENTRR
jgi:hypothetical protein